MFDDKTHVSDVTETIVFDCCVVFQLGRHAFTINLVLLKCRQMSCVFSFIVRVAVCMVGGSVCVLFDDIKYVSDVAETIA